MFVAWCRSQRRRCDGKRALPQQLLGFNLSGINRSKWHILMYMPRQPTVRLRRWTMERKAKIFMNNRSQAVRLPKEFQFKTQEVFIRKEGSDVVLSPRPFDWSLYLAEGPVASQSFMEGIEDLPVQEREP